MIKQRLLSPDGLTKRIALLDNVKTLRFSWAELEAMITAPEISGKRLYVGNATRPNNLTWIVTLNGASLSTDMAQRCVIVKLRKPEYTGTWEEETYAFIRDNRDAIIGDIIGFLRSERKPLERHSRWGDWEDDVLSRLPDPAEAQLIIAQRQQTSDVEEEEADLIEDYFKGELRALNYAPDLDVIFIPSTLVCRWFNCAANERMRTTSVTRLLRQWISEGRLHRIQHNKCLTYGRGFVWVGESADPSDRINTDIEARIEHVKEWPKR